jgi:type III secretion system FlhB-like substrate exporter
MLSSYRANIKIKETQSLINSMLKAEIKKEIGLKKD